ncbi:MAG: FKBP-type peptidyl-prolyl cis-trans isomerase [Magnetococcales bacterium]|nr:FKBP-type peptidyl-prolyl cis-trans isomerase [Magnetococcales bacterium]
MKPVVKGSLGLACLLAIQVVWAGEPDLKGDKERFSYTLGVQLGQEIRGLGNNSGVAFDLDSLMLGVKDSIEGGKLRLTPDEIRKVRMDFEEKMKKSAKEHMAKLAEENKRLGEAFQASNRTKAGVTVTESGLQFEVLRSGNGPKPKVEDRVRLHYRGTTIDGREFDSSYRRGAPATFSVKEVVPGWTEGLQLMATGGQYRLVVPSKLAYGERGSASIEPNATLVFEVELLAVNP